MDPFQLTKSLSSDFHNWTVSQTVKICSEYFKMKLLSEVWPEINVLISNRSLLKKHNPIFRHLGKAGCHNLH